MAEDGDGEEGSGGDPRMKLLELYGLKTLKQVCRVGLHVSKPRIQRGYLHVVFNFL